MDIGFYAFDPICRPDDSATHPSARLVMRLPWSLVVAGTGLSPSRFVASTRPDAPSGASNYGF